MVSLNLFYSKQMIRSVSKIRNFFFETGNSFWFVLKSKTLSCQDYKNGHENKFTISSDFIKARQIRQKQFSNKYYITLYNPNGYVYGNALQLDLSSEDENYIKSWASDLDKVFNKVETVSQVFFSSKINRCI